MNKAQKEKIIEKFKNGIQKIGYLLQNIVFTDEDGRIVSNLDADFNKKQQYFNQIMLKKREINNNIPEDVRDEICSRVETAVISGYSELNDFITTPFPTEQNRLELSSTLKGTIQSIQQIPDEIDNLYKDKKLNYKNLKTCIGFEVVESNEQNALASNELLASLNFENKEIKKEKANII